MGLTTTIPSSIKTKDGQLKIPLAIFATNLIIFLDILAVSIFIPRLVFRLKDLSLSNAHVSLILPVYGLVQIFSCPLIGWGGDLHGRKLILMSCTGVTAVSYLILGSSSHWLLIFAARAIAGFFKQTQLLGKAILSDLASSSPKHDLCTVLGNSEAFGLTGFVFGPAIGSYLTSKYYADSSEDSFTFLCCLASAILVVNMSVIATLIPNETKGKSCKEMSATATSESDSIVHNNNKEKSLDAQRMSSPTPTTSITVPVFVTITFLFCTAIHTMRESMSIYVLEKFNLTVTEYGYLVSVQTILSASATFVSGPVISHIYSGEYKSVVVQSGILQMIAVASVYLNTSSYSIAWVSLLCVAIANQYLGVGIKALALQDSTKNSGSVLGFAQTATVGLHLNNCGQVILYGCISAFMAVLITSKFVQVQEKITARESALNGKNDKRLGAYIKVNQFLRFSQDFFTSKPKIS